MYLLYNLQIHCNRNRNNVASGASKKFWGALDTVPKQTYTTLLCTLKVVTFLFSFFFFFFGLKLSWSQNFGLLGSRFGRIQDLGFLIITYTNRIREISLKSPLAYGTRRESLRGVLHVNSHNNFAKEPF